LGESGFDNFAKSDSWAVDISSSVRIKIQQFLFGKSHSWSLVGQNIGRALIRRGHDVEFISTDGIVEKFHPEDLRPFTKEKPEGLYDMQISYTAPHNWPHFTANGKKNKFVIWNYEYNKKENSNASLLPGFGKYHSAVDLVLPSSNFSKEVFLNMGVPLEKMVVVPHGINLEDYSSESFYPIKCKKAKKILLNIAQPHKRKAIHLALESFGRAFNKNDDVVLVAKVLKSNAQNMAFDVDFNFIFAEFKKKFPNHAPVELIYDYIPNITSLYKSCHINFSATHAECWHLPSLEALACGLVNVVPRYGGILHFCNDENSLLIDGTISRVDKTHQYWNPNPHAVHYVIDVNDAAQKLKFAVENYDKLLNDKCQFIENTVKQFTWENVAIQLEGLCQ
jgi:glycosyltransferase involved in cell wall biosynthesis